ncbi:MAG TPA: glycoside hydrolase family 44 protein, partial [Verrucomicrobiae bacterium]|nr:glycoside hydrolase family 44 protein [Verrucomicrobiae bacterium]
ATNFVHSGTDSISVLCVSNNYQALYLHHPAFDSSLYTNLIFWINGGASGGQPLKVQATLNGVAQSAYYGLPTLTANTWQQFTIPLSSLGVADQPNMDGFWIESESASPIPIFYVDDIQLQGAPPTPPGTNAMAAIMVNVVSNRHSINSFVYGVAYATSNQLADLNCPLNRSGGNAETRYNWQINAHNRAADFYFESIGDSPAVAGASADQFVQSSKVGGALPLITIPMIGWAPILGSGRAKLASYSIAKYGPQTGNDASYFPDAGNGISVTNNTHITWNNPTDANTPVDSTFEKGYIQHLTNAWGVSTNGGVRYYLMDNEHSIWFSTHQDVHPVGPTMQEIRDKIIDYGGMVKSLDPNALVLGPEEWGWSGYFYSGYDQQWSGAHGDYNPADYPDRGTNGGMDYIPWLLTQIQLHDSTNGQRLLDYLTVHCYPQGGEGANNGNNVDSATQLLRNRSTRSLWDTNYVDASWIDSIVMLIPRLKNWVAAYYPGTKIGITEYNWGAEGYINGATTQADIYGIFGRENLDLGTRWTTPATGTPTYNAMKMYRNYDGTKSTFGDTSVYASGPNPDNVSVFAAQRSPDATLTIMVISKYLSGTTPVSVTLSNFTGTGTAQVWQLNSTNMITRLSDIHYIAGTLSTYVPGQSVTLFVIPPQPAKLVAGPARSDGQFEFWLDGEAGQTFVLQSSSNLVSWTPVITNTLASNQFHFLLPRASSRQFYRALRQ